MNTLKRIIVCLYIVVMIPIYNLSVFAEYDDDYRQKLFALYNCLDEQLTEFEQTEENDVILRFGEMQINDYGYETTGAIKWMDLQKIIAVLCGEHPRLISSVNFLGNRLRSIKTPEILTGVHLSRLSIDGTYKDMYNRIDNRADEILTQIISDGMTDLDKAFAVHMYLLKNCNSNGDISNKDRDTIYGSIILNSAACGGFANAYKLFMDKLGIPCEIAEGFSAGHLWNYVQIEGKWYHVDATKKIDKYKRFSAYTFLVDEETRQQQVLRGERVYDWESINKDVVCDSNKFNTDYLFRHLCDDNLKSLSYHDGVWSYTIDGIPFENHSLKSMNMLVSLPLSDNDEVVGLNNIDNSHLVIYGAPKFFDEYVVFYDENDAVIDILKNDVQYLSETLDISCTPPENTAYMRIFMWDGMTPLSQVTEVRR